MLKTRVALAILAAAVCGCATPASTPEPADPAAEYEAAIMAWRKNRVTNLTSDTGWLTLTALYRLEARSYRLGSAPAADLALPAEAPAFAGTLEVRDDGIILRWPDEVEVTASGEALTSPAEAFGASLEPTVFEIGPVNFFVIERGDVRLLRVRNRNHPERGNFAGLDYFPIDPALRFSARFEPYDPVKQIPVANVIGIVSDSPSWGAVTFESGGATHRIDAIAEPGDEELFLIFGDATSGKETYGAGRYLYVDAPDAEGRIDLDFNRAYNPPCAFTAFATCPLPPRQNRLDLRIAAGELNYTAGAH